MKKKIIREWGGTRNAIWYDSPKREGYGELLKKLTNIKKWQVSDYTNIEHPFCKRVKNTKDKYTILESYYFDTDSVKLLLNYFENDLETKMQKLIDNPPTLEPDDAFFDEPYALETVSFKDKTITMDLLHKEFQEVWTLSIIVESLQDEVNNNGGLYIIYAEYIGK